MKTSIDQQLLLFSILDDSNIETLLSGRIYQDARPNFKTEDIVILGLPIVGNAEQRGQAIINIYVPDSEVTENNTPYFKSDSARIKELSDAVIAIIKSYSGDEFNLSVSSGETFVDADNKMKFHYYSLKVSFEFFNP